MNWKFWQRDAGETTGGAGSGGLIGRIAGGVIGLYLLLCLLVGWWWDYEPDLFRYEKTPLSTPRPTIASW